MNFVMFENFGEFYICIIVYIMIGNKGINININIDIYYVINLN